MQTIELVACGLLSGFLAGLLGIGGGLVVVPALYLLLPRADTAVELLPHMAVATSLAAMIPTTIAALAAHWRRGAVDTLWLRRMAPGVGVGALLGVSLVPRIDATWLSALFALYAVGCAVRMLRVPAQVAAPTGGARWPIWLVAAGIGGVSVLVGVGGATFTVPYLQQQALRMASASATSSGIGLVLSLVAVAGFLVAAHGSSRIGPDTAALVWWPGAAVIGLSAVLTAPLGVRAAHRWPTAVLKRCFAGVLITAAASALWKVHAF